MIKKLWWCLCTPTQIQLFYTSGGWRMRLFLGVEAAMKAAQREFDRCSKSEQDFIIWRDPVFEYFRSNK